MNYPHIYRLLCRSADPFSASMILLEALHGSRWALQWIKVLRGRR